MECYRPVAKLALEEINVKLSNMDSRILTLEGKLSYEKLTHHKYIDFIKDLRLFTWKDFNVVRYMSSYEFMHKKQIASHQ